MLENQQENKMLVKIFRDEADLQVSTDKVENEETTETPEDESPEDDNKPAEDTEEPVSDDSEDKSDDSEDDKESEKSDEDDDLYETEEEYVGQFGLPDNIKTTHEALEHLIANQGKTESDTKLEQIDKYLRSKGIDGVDGFLAQQQVAPAPARPAQSKYVSATEILNNNITSGLVDEGSATLFRPIVENFDATSRLFGAGMEEMMARLESIEQGHQQTVSKQNDADYQSFVTQSKNMGFSAYKKHRLDKIMERLPSDTTYLEAQAFLTVKDPNKMRNQLNVMKKQVEKGAFRKLRNKEGKFLKTKGRKGKISGKVYSDYLDSEGEPTGAFYKLSREEQHRLTKGVFEKT